MLYLSWFVSGAMCAITYLFLFNKVANDKKFEFTTKEMVASLLFSVTYVFLMCSKMAVSRPFLVHIMFFIMFLILYKKPVIKTLIGELYVMLLVLTSELIWSMILTYVITVNPATIVNDYIYNSIVSNIIYITAIIFSKIEFIGIIYSTSISNYNKTGLKKPIIFSLEALTLAIFALYINFTNRMPKDLLLFTNVILVCGLIFIVSFFKEKNYSNRIKTEYDNLIDYVKTYEKIINEKSKNQHEYKNQLIVIKNLISSSKKEAINYINGLYNHEVDNNEIDETRKLSYLPDGGIKGLIYYKIEQMHLNGIEVFVDVSKKISSSNIKKILDKHLYDITCIIGVYLDNAIEACHDAKKKSIIIEVYDNDDSIVFSFSNTYSGHIKLNKVDKEGYTTKGEGHGYGLSLVKDLIHFNKCLNQEKVLNGIYYTQKLSIKKSK